MKYLAMLKNEENTYQEALPKLPEPPFDSFDSDPERHVSEKQAPPDPAPKTPEAVAGDWYDARICEVIDDLADVQMMTYPEHVRDAARLLFDEFSEAAAADDMPRFWAALREWKRTWKRGLH
mgnify:CR=1 FL=1